MRKEQQIVERLDLLEGSLNYLHHISGNNYDDNPIWSKRNATLRRKTIVRSLRKVKELRELILRDVNEQISQV